MRGSGDSKGQFLTLGIREYKDLYCLIRKLQKDYKAEKIILYGRSMGAVALMKFISEFKRGNHPFNGINSLDKSLPKVEGIILDSPFHTVEKFFNNFTKQKLNSYFIFMINCFLNFLY